MTKQINVRLDAIHIELLDTMVDRLKAQGIKTNRTDMIEKAIYNFARESVLDTEMVKDVIDRHYQGNHWRK